MKEIQTNQLRKLTAEQIVKAFVNSYVALDVDGVRIFGN